MLFHGLKENAIRIKAAHLSQGRCWSFATAEDGSKMETSDKLSVKICALCGEVFIGIPAREAHNKLVHPTKLVC